MKESERCPAYNHRQDDDDSQLHLHSSATSLSRLLLDGAVPVNIVRSDMSNKNSNNQDTVYVALVMMWKVENLSPKCPVMCRVEC